MGMVGTYSLMRADQERAVGETEDAEEMLLLPDSTSFDIDVIQTYCNVQPIYQEKCGVIEMVKSFYMRRRLNGSN